MNISSSRIEILLAERKMNMTKLADAAGVSRQTLSTVVRRGTCAPITAGRVAEGLGVEVTDIIQQEAN